MFLGECLLYSLCNLKRIVLFEALVFSVFLYVIVLECTSFVFLVFWFFLMYYNLKVSLDGFQFGTNDSKFFLELFMCVVLNTNFRASLRLICGIV